MNDTQTLAAELRERGAILFALAGGAAGNTASVSTHVLEMREHGQLLLRAATALDALRADAAQQAADAALGRALVEAVGLWEDVGGWRDALMQKLPENVAGMLTEALTAATAAARGKT